ncbi:MAG TPA: SpoIID/LytB domain-containing protein [Bacteroidales bacterium]|nr:SpoIID/LytB domain-containing protein [Bacteroidales bacterium]
MRFFRVSIFIVSLLVAEIACGGTFIDIHIFTGYRINTFNFTPLSGKYSVFDADKKICDILRNQTITFKVASDSILVYNANVKTGSFTSLNISGSGLLNNFKIKPGNYNVKERNYDDNLQISVEDGYFVIINQVELENYVAGVVQSEGGGSVKDNDFYLVQAITCRTYALNNIKKHAREGFNLCDSVHCQLYLGRCKTNEILAATFKTAGDVIVDKDNKMISAAFHANSGGQTVNSEDIWKIPTSYLKSVSDTFSLHMMGAAWEEKILQTNWLDYLSTRFNYPVDDPAKKNYALNFKQDKRMVYFSDSIPLSVIRYDLGLKSTWFSISPSGSNVLIKGKGYGHGVGLSQQGAIRMAQLGYNYLDIIKFYYKDVEVVNYDELNIK